MRAESAAACFLLLLFLLLLMLPEMYLRRGRPSPRSSCNYCRNLLDFGYDYGYDCCCCYYYYYCCCCCCYYYYY